ncbi:MAG: FAD-binding oxidoreductase [Thermoplasmata archaeon]|nr:FAD-binding oxidoreductase [Thermoplasmata archaeon]
MNTPEFDVAIVGAGIIGASCALECVGAGLRVVVVDAHEPGAGTTATNMGQILVVDGSDPEFLLTRFGVRLWNELSDDLPPNVEFERLGTIWIAAGEDEMRVAEHREQFYSRHGVAAELLDAEALRREEPHLRSGLLGGLQLPNDATVNGTLVTRFFLDRVLLAGGRVLSGVAAQTFDPTGVRLHGGELLTATHLVNATGVASPVLSPGVPVRPRKGHLAITDRRPGFVRHALGEIDYVRRAQDIAQDSVSFNVQPRPEGQVRIGSSRQLGVAGSEVDPRVLRSMVDRASEYLPGLSGFPITRSYTGLRPASIDGLPLIGRWTPQAGVYLATGHEGLGITMALATGRLLVDQLLDRRSEIPIEPYLPARVLDRNGRAAIPESPATQKH